MIFTRKFINHMFKINVEVKVNKQQYQSIQTSFFRCEPQIGFQISQSTKRTLICCGSNRTKLSILEEELPKMDTYVFLMRQQQA